MANKSYAQNNEDILVDNIFEKFKINRTQCSVEFGGWDGIYLSNIAYFNKKYNDKLLFIEGDSKRVKDGINNYSGNNNVLFENSFVSYSGKNSLDKILSRNKIPKNFDILSIDIDGNDYHVWDSLKSFHPSIVIIEYNFTIPNEVDYVQEKNFKINQGSSAKSLCDLAQKKGYTLIETTKSNLIFLKSKYLKTNSKNNLILNKLRDDSNFRTYVFYGYDGKIILSKKIKMYWQKYTINKTRFQIIPSFLRKYPRDNSIFSNFLRFINKRIK